MGESLQDLDDRRVLEEPSGHGTEPGWLSVMQADQSTQGSRIKEIHLGCFDKSFPIVGEVGAYQHTLVTGLQQREPSLGSIDRDPEIPRQGSEVEQLTHAGGKAAQEDLELGQVPDIAQEPYVALEIRLQVRGMPESSIPLWIQAYFWISAADDSSPWVG